MGVICYFNSSAEFAECRFTARVSIGLYGENIDSSKKLKLSKSPLISFASVTKRKKM